MMLNNTSWLWKAKAEQHGWGDRSAHFAWEMHQNRGEHRWSQGRFCYLALCCLFMKRKRGPWVTSVFCFVLPVALHPYAYSCSAVAGSFLIYAKKYKQICVECSCGEQTWVWPRGFVNFVSPFQNPLSTFFLNRKGSHCNVVFSRLKLHLHCVAKDRIPDCRTTSSYCLSFPGRRSGLIVCCYLKEPWACLLDSFECWPSSFPSFNFLVLARGRDTGIFLSIIQ